MSKQDSTISDKDYKPIIIEALDTLRKKDVAEKRPFQARAYKKVLEQLAALTIPVRDISDLTGIEGVGDKMRAKFDEILKTGSLAAATRAKEAFPIELYDTLQKIYGVGPVKAKDLVEKHNVANIEDLRKKITENPNILNAKQIIGLRYYEDINERIHRSEMEEHEKILMTALPKSLQGIVVGSFRRGASTSGDIDMLITGNENVCTKEFVKYINILKKQGYISDILAEGDKKCLAVAKLPGKKTGYRRLDLLVTPPQEYAYAILYFTGSAAFNVAMRKYALTKGYSLNEHILTKLPGFADNADIPYMNNEKDIFTFLGLQYVEPNKRVDTTNLIVMI